MIDANEKLLYVIWERAHRYMNKYYLQNPKRTYFFVFDHEMNNLSSDTLFGRLFVATENVSY